MVNDFPHSNYSFTSISEAVSPEVFCKKVLLKFGKIHRKTPVLESFLIKKVLLKRRVLHRCFPVLKRRLFHRSFSVNVAKFLINTFYLWKTSGGCFCLCQYQHFLQTSSLEL